MTILLEGMSKLGKFLYYTKSISIYKMKGSSKVGGIIWNWWNPISWVLAPLGFLFYGFMEGFPEAVKYKYDVGFGIKPFYKDKEIEWN